MTALKINIPEVSAEIVLSCSAIFAAAMTKDKVEVNKNAEAIVVLVSNQRFINKTGISFDTTKAMMSTGIIKSRDGSLIKDGILRSTPTIIKNIGIKNPYPNESNFSTISSSGFNNETTTPARMHLKYTLHLHLQQVLLIKLLMQNCTNPNLSCAIL